MRKQISLFAVMLFVLCLSSISFGQDFPAKENNSNTLDYAGPQNQVRGGVGLTTVLPGNFSTSTLGRSPQGSRRFINTKYIITGSEMTASGYTGAVTSVGWRWNVSNPPAATDPIAQSVTTTGSLRVYLRDTLATAQVLGSTFIDTLGAGYTKIIDGTITIPDGLAEINIDVPVGGPGTSAFTPTPGNGVILIFIYKTTDAALATPIGAPVTCCINSGSGIKLSTFTSTTTSGSNGTTSIFRPETRFGFTPVNCDLGVFNLYPIGALNPDCTPTTVAPKAKIFNNGILDQTGISVRYQVVAEGYDATVSGLSVNAGGNLEVNFPGTLPINGNSPGVKDVIITTSGTCDGNPVVYVTNSSYEVLSINVVVNPGAGCYSTLKYAFDAINAGTHMGAVTVDIINGTTETETAALNASGTGSANYTSVVITTSNGAGVTVEGNLAAAAIIRLIGADNVTIDGRIGGTGRFITVRNNSNALNATGIWLSNGSAATDSLGAQNNVIRNCEISCNLRVDSSASNTFGILAGSSVIGINAGRNNDNNSYMDNRIVKCRYGILLHGGAAVNRSDNNTITGNIIGPDIAGVDNIGKVGIFAQFQDNCLISNNHVQNVGGTFDATTAGADRVGIGAGSESWASAPTTTTGGNYTVTNNKVHDVTEGRTFSSVGILCASTRSGEPTNNVVVNNEIYNIIGNGTVGDACWGIGHSGSTSGDLIAFNSIYMTGLLDPAPSVPTTQVSGGIRVAVSADSNTTVKNNSIYVDLTSATVSLMKVCIQMPSATYQFGAAELDNNDYYPGSPAVGPNPQMALGALGTTSLPTTFVSTLAAWQTTFTPVNQDANSISANPIYTLAAPNWLIPQDGSPLLTEADPIAGITTDILGETRSAFLPTIGAYEFTEQTLPVELAAFTASVNNKDVTLNWSTVSELNNAGFDIERRLVGSEWSSVGNVQGHGTVSTPQNYSYTDRGLASGKYNYRLKQIDFNGNFEYFNLSSEVSVGIPTKFDLSQNYPNPFNPSTSINFDLPVDGKVSLKIFDMTGKEMMTLVNEVRTAGYYSVNFNASNLSSGVYFYTLSAGNFLATKKMMLLK